MALQSRPLGVHNRMLGQRISHPSSTKFDDDYPVPEAKRRKTKENNQSKPNTGPLSDEDVEALRGSHSSSKKASDLDEDSDGEAITLHSSKKTDLESTLPPVETDAHAIRDYEATRAAEAADLGIQGRLGQRKWIPGKSSIYVDAFNLALETVLEEESHLYNEAELKVFDHWRNLSYEGQYLYVRLFLRKTAAWHRINRLGYYGDIGDMSMAVKELFEQRSLPDCDTDKIVHPGEPEAPSEPRLAGSFTFADGSEDHINSLEEASSLLMLDELKSLAREAKFEGKNKADLLKALRRTSSLQSGLGWGGLKRSDTEESIVSDCSIAADEYGILDDAENVSGRVSNRDDHYVKKILASTGPCIRLSSPAHTLFERVHLVFYRSTEWTENSLTTIILARISRRNFPEYLVSRSTNIFTSRSQLLEFEASIRTQFRIDSILEFNGTVRRDGLEAVKTIFEQVYPRWKTILAEEQSKEDRVYDSGEGAYLRRFSPAWVYTRIVHKGTYVLGRFKEHEREHRLLSELLEQRLFHAARRGAWYQRKALLEEHYMYALQPLSDLSEEAQRRHWKKIALHTCEDGLQDRDCHLIYHYDLQKRLKKLEKSLKVPKREHHDFGHVRLAKPVERTVHGIRIEKERTPARSSSRTRRSSTDGNTGRGKGGKTIWVDEREGGGECSVEEMCLSHYRDLGWKGYHSEGGIVRTLFAYLFFDVLFTYIPNVFQTPYQTCPLDLHTDAFYPSRASEINHRLMEISNGDAETILKNVYENEKGRQTCVVGLHWDFAIEDLLEIVRCFQGEALATLCKIMAQEYQQRGGGIPDLFLWRIHDGIDEKAEKDDKGTVMFAEVKSENDRLSDTQRLWIHVLTGAGINVELCAAVAKEVKTIR